MSTFADSVPPASILSTATATSAEIAPAGAVNVLLPWIQSPREATAVRKPFPLMKPWQAAPGVQARASSTPPVVVSPALNRTSADKVYCCPADWPAYLGTLLDEHPAAVKAGLGLRTDDLPPWFERRDEVRLWEAKYQPGCARPAGSWSAVWADVDTTLAMYRRLGPFRLGPAIRTTAPYEALHLPWYEDTKRLPEEIRFYNDRAEHGHWRAPGGFEDHHGLGG